MMGQVSLWDNPYSAVGLLVPVWSRAFGILPQRSPVSILFKKSDFAASRTQLGPVIKRPNSSRHPCPQPIIRRRRRRIRGGRPVPAVVRGPNHWISLLAARRLRRDVRPAPRARLL